MRAKLQGSSSSSKIHRFYRTPTQKPLLSGRKSAGNEDRGGSSFQTAPTDRCGESRQSKRSGTTRPSTRGSRPSTGHQRPFSSRVGGAKGSVTERGEKERPSALERRKMASSRVQSMKFAGILKDCKQMLRMNKIEKEYLVQKEKELEPTLP